MSSTSTNRTGRVSSIDYERGTYEVTYRDRGQSVTKEINMISNGEYKMPKVGQTVAINHNSNGTEAGVTTGTVWNSSNTPAEGYEGLFRKEYGQQKGECYERYDSNTGVYTQYAPVRTGRNSNGEIYDEAKGSISLIAAGQVQIESTGSSMSISAAQSTGVNSGTVMVINAGTDMTMEASANMGIVSGGTLQQQHGGDADIKYKGKLTEEVTKDAKIEYKAKLEEKVTGEAKLDFPGGLKITVGGCTIEIDTSGNVKIEAPKIELKAADGEAEIKTIKLTKHKHGGGPEPDPG